MKFSGTILLTLGVILGLIGGIYTGMIMQQMIFGALAVEFGESLAGTNINVTVNLNETKLIEGFNETMKPVFQSIINMNNKTKENIK